MLWIEGLRGLKDYNTVHCSFNPDLTYSCPHDSSSSLDPSILNFRHSRPSLIVIPRTEMMSAKNRYNVKQTTLFSLHTLQVGVAIRTLSIIALKCIAKHYFTPIQRKKRNNNKKDKLNHHIMWPLHKTVTWYKITPCWVVNYAKGQEKQKDYINQKANILSCHGHTTSFAIQQGVFCTMWPHCAKSPFI